MLCFENDCSGANKLTDISNKTYRGMDGLTKKKFVIIIKLEIATESEIVMFCFKCKLAKSKTGEATHLGFPTS